MGGPSENENEPSFQEGKENTTNLTSFVEEAQNSVKVCARKRKLNKINEPDT